MADRPIIFSGPMVRALLDGRKTQTRRVLGQPSDDVEPPYVARYPEGARAVWSDPDGSLHAFPGAAGAAVGDRLWVKETWSHTGQGVWSTRDVPHALGGRPIYRADDDLPGVGWFPSIFMFRTVSRLTLAVTGVRVQRLQEITGRDVLAEGVRCEGCFACGTNACRDGGCFEAKALFRDLWNSLHGRDSWDANPWIVAVSFTVHRCNIDALVEGAQP